MMDVLGVLIEKYEDEHVPELTVRKPVSDATAAVDSKND